jgi:hypothetical protein
MERKQFIQFIQTIPYGTKIRAGLISIYDKIASIAGIDKATQDEDGLMSKEDKKKLDGLESLTQATSTTLGGVKIGYTTATTADRNYAVQLDSDGKMFVNVPWIDRNATYTAATDTVFGLVKQAAKVAKPADDTNANLKVAIDAIIDAMTTARQMKA